MIPSGYLRISRLAHLGTSVRSKLKTRHDVMIAGIGWLSWVISMFALFKGICWVGHTGTACVTGILPMGGVRKSLAGGRGHDTE